MKRLNWLLIIACTASMAQATVIDFEGLNDQQKIPDGYKNLNWGSNSYSFAPNDYIFQPSGYQTALTSGRMVALGWFENDFEFTTISGLIDVHGMQLAAAWNDGLNLNIRGYAGATLLYNQNFTLDVFTKTSLTNLGYLGVDRMVFSSSGGVDNPIAPAGGTHFGVDDIVYTEAGVPLVPEPFTMGLAALGLGVALKRRRK